jgi:hypothetical protein
MPGCTEAGYARAVDVVLALDRLDEPTLDWFHGQRRVLAAAGVVDELPAEPADSLAFLAAQPEAVEAAEGEPVAILHRWLGPFGEPLEQTLIDVGAIRAVGVRR